MAGTAGALRICHVTQPVSGGVAHCVESLVADQVGRGWDVSVACPADGHLPDRLRAAGRRIWSWSAVRSPTVPAVARELWELDRILAELRPDIIHLHSSKAGLIGRLLIRQRIPTIFQPHSWSFHAASRPARAAVVGWERVAARWADVVLCVSELERQEGVQAGLAGTPMTVVRNGVDPARWPFAGPARRAAARTELGLPATAPVAVTVGRLCEQKGQDLLLRAWSSIRGRVPDARLVLVGDGPARAAFRAAAGRQPGVRVVGESAQPGSWLAAANVVVLPSRWEGMPFALLEAAATGRSIVATDVGGARELIGAGADAAGAVVGVAGMLGLPAGGIRRHRFRDESALVSELAMAVAARLLDPGLADVEGRAARRNAVNGFTLGAMLDATADLTAQLATSRRARSRAAHRRAARTALPHATRHRTGSGPTASVVGPDATRTPCAVHVDGQRPG